MQDLTLGNSIIASPLLNQKSISSMIIDILVLIFLFTIANNQSNITNAFQEHSSDSFSSLKNINKFQDLNKQLAASQEKISSLYLQISKNEAQYGNLISNFEKLNAQVLSLFYKVIILNKLLIVFT